MKRPRGLHLFRDLHTPLVHVVGDRLKARVEAVDHKLSPDHVWIGLDPGLSVRVLVSVNTFSLRNGEAGHDPRVRVGIQRGTWEHAPGRGVGECPWYSYEEIPGIGSVEFRPLERVILEQMLLDRVRRARLLEVWGTPYHRESPGIHQIHSRRPSCAIPQSVEGRDGALRFYFDDGAGARTTELLLFKFCGQ